MEDRLERLIAEGEQLVPLGGGDVSTGPNRGLQDDYVVWRSRCVELLTEAALRVSDRANTTFRQRLREVPSDMRQRMLDTAG